MSPLSPGDLLAAGRTSDVFEYGRDAVVKVPRVGVPAHWAAAEAAFSDAIEPLGLPAPRVRSLVEVDGRPSIVFDRINGPSMWEVMCDDPVAAPDLAVLLAKVQHRIHSAGLVPGVPCLARRTARKIAEVADLSAEERDLASELTEAMPRGAALLHGDLHPGNVLMSDSGPMVIDWFDASIGHPIADVTRSSFLLRSPENGRIPDHLPGALPGLLPALREAYLDAVGDVVLGREAIAADWERLVAVSRLAEGAGDDHEELLKIWRSRPATLSAG